MKTRTYLLIFGAILALCAAALLLLPRMGDGKTAEIYLDGELIRTVDLGKNETFTVESERGSNEITVENGTIRVSAATCPDQICVRRGACSDGAPVVCLPNRLVIRFPGSGETDVKTG